jgi:hypothetical protein
MAEESLIDWAEWSDDAFSRAVAGQVPVLLRITSSWCASCRQMEQEADRDPYVAATINNNYVAVRVDSDLRPDISERYNMGGWPTNAFLTPKGELITGGTYFDGPTFRLLLDRVSQNWSERRQEVEDAVAATRREHEQRRRVRTVEGVPAAPMVEAIVDQTIDAFDFRYGGFGREPKFPHAASIELLLAESRRTGEGRLRDAALLSLEAMADPERTVTRLADTVGGGFFRYAARRDWSEPRFEKMLEDNAQLLSVYLSAHQLTGEARWADAARATVTYMTSTLWDARSGYMGGSQAAGDGAGYYSLDTESRAAWPPPPVDWTVYVSRNAQAASAMIKAGLVLGDDAALELGVGLADRLAAEGRLGPDDRLMAHVIAAAGNRGPVLLGNQVHTACALVDAYEAVGGISRLAQAGELLDEVHSRLCDTARRAYTDTIVDPGAEGLLSVPFFPLAENSLAADTLVRLSHLLEAPAYRARAAHLLQVMAGVATDFGFLAAQYALAVLRSIETEPVVIQLAPSADTAAVRSLARATQAIYAPFKLVQHLEPERDQARLRAFGGAGTPAAILCRGANCSEPTSDPEGLVVLLARVAAAAAGR